MKDTKLGTAILTVLVKDKEVGKLEFRVKDLPDPVAKIGGRKSSTVEKSWLVLQSKLVAELEGSEFDYRFKILSFSMSALLNGKETTIVSSDEKITKEQYELIKNLPVDGKITISEIKAMGPEGTPRVLPPLVFTLGK